MKFIATILFAITFLRSDAQQISGKVTGEKKSPVANASVLVYRGGRLLIGHVSAYDGFYRFSPLEPGTYNVLVFYPGYDSMLVTNVPVFPGHNTLANFDLPGKVGVQKCSVVQYKKAVPVAPDVQPKEEPIRIIGGGEIPDIASTYPGIYQQQRGHPDVQINRPNEKWSVCYCTGLSTHPRADYYDPYPNNIDAPNSQILTREEITHMPIMSLTDAITIFPGVYQQRRGSAINIYGSRADGIKYIVDGMQIQ